MELIVNADDLGISRKVNQATFDLMEQGRVTSATLLANGPNVEEACERIHEFASCSFGSRRWSGTQISPIQKKRRSV